ncbi:hypothetical protein NEMBOFW57_006056 [Staphylotrichum longicolle]|uniref:Aminotransferase class IV n=1 Tax=Staphylotrichum longicolle TaxID=669026 RepID=A0AAD4I0W7_9PEZI|nr:hypothetical protein NEMBOFW57_006056 [Staphylotrichum longicolle]
MVDFQLFSSLRYDPALSQVSGSSLSHAGWNWANASPLYMLDYHRDRMLLAATHWGWDAAVEFLKGEAGLQRLGDRIMSSIGEDKQSPMKVRVAITKEGWEILVDSSKTARSEHTHFKTTHRPPYDGARQRAQISLPDKKEVLIVNEADGSVMEGSVTTPYFWRKGRWVTPAVSKTFSHEDGNGGQNGTSRRWALERYVSSIMSETSIVTNS